MDNHKPLSLAQILQRLDNGGTVEEIQTHIRDVSNSVLETGNQGSITIKMTFARDGGEGSRRLMIRDQVTSTKPKKPKPITLLFTNYDGDLTLANPDQPNLSEVDA